jgi:hypothetical protein
MNPNPSPETRFQPGQSGNPAGRPVGSRNKVTLLAESIIEEHLGEVVAAQCLRAKAGSEPAQRFIISRALAPARRRPVMIDLPEVDTLDGLVAAHERVTRLFAEGVLTDEEAKAASKLFEAHRQTLEVAELARRLAAVEAELGLPPG